MYTNLTKKLTALLTLVKNINNSDPKSKTTTISQPMVSRDPAKPIIDRKQDGMLRALHAALHEAKNVHKDEDLVKEVLTHIDKRHAELDQQEKKIREAMGAPEIEIVKRPAKSKIETEKTKKVSPFTMEHVKNVSLMDHDAAKEFTWNLVHNHNMSVPHKSELKYRIHKTKNTPELMKLMSDHILSPHPKIKL